MNTLSSPGLVMTMHCQPLVLTLGYGPLAQFLCRQVGHYLWTSMLHFLGSQEVRFCFLRNAQSCRTHHLAYKGFMDSGLKKPKTHGILAC